MTAFWVAFAVALLLTGAMISVLRRVGLYDVPNDRSSHEKPTPRGGGVAVMVAVAVALVASPDADAWWPLAAALVLATVGLVDDVRSVSARVRLTAQVVVAAAASGALAVTVAGPLWPPLLVAAGIVAIVAYVNAFNFMDGVNAISGLNAGLAGVWFMWTGHFQEVPAVALLGATLAGSALGFLPWNVRGTVFLGDVGSYGIGALIATTAVLAWASGIPALLVLAPLVVYVADTGWAILTHVRAGKPLAHPHRDHVYQRLAARGWPHLLPAGWSVLAAGAACVAVAALNDRQPVLAGILCLAVAAVYLASPTIMARVATSRTGRVA